MRPFLQYNIPPSADGNQHSTGKNPLQSRQRRRFGYPQTPRAARRCCIATPATPTMMPAAAADAPIIVRFAPDRTSALATNKEIAGFLAEVERRAFKQAMFATRNDEAALDIVQDAMLKLTEKYAAKPAGELPMLFARILQNTINDHFRRQKVRNTWTTLLSAFGKNDDKEDEYDLLESLPAKSASNLAADPAGQFEQAEVVRLIEMALERLPARQREAFLLRYWEELDVAEAAAVMGCAEGSVKTHCSRAVHALAEMLKAKGLQP